jgi:hypothetical protein
LQEVWNIKDDTHKDRCLFSMGILYRNWRGTLHRSFMLKDKSPCSEWSILEEDWEAFKRHKKTPESKVKLKTFNI